MPGAAGYGRKLDLRGALFSRHRIADDEHHGTVTGADREGAPVTCANVVGQASSAGVCH
jgi:hypothetical protein